jgi:hypothetical protein
VRTVFERHRSFEATSLLITLATHGLSAQALRSW